MKPGYLTSEFCLAALTILAVVVLAALDKVSGEAAMAAVGAATFGYSASRGLAKAVPPKDSEGVLD